MGDDVNFLRKGYRQDATLRYTILLRVDPIRTLKDISLKQTSITLIQRSIRQSGTRRYITRRQMCIIISLLI